MEVEWYQNHLEHILKSQDMIAAGMESIWQPVRLFLHVISCFGDRG